MKKPDHLDSQLPYLTTEELQKIYQNRRESADMALGQLLFRLFHAERAEAENAVLISLLKECRSLVIPLMPGTAEELEPKLKSLSDRINSAIRSHEELYGES